MGGKKLLRKEICSRFTEHAKTYVEVFGGAGWVLFYKEKHTEKEVFNDINSELTNLFKCVKYHPDAIVKDMEYLLNSRETFNLFKNQSTEGLTDIQRAARYLYLIRASYGSKVNTYGAKSRDLINFRNISDIQKRLAKVIIENKSYDALIKQYDKPETSFYLDPPYFGAEHFYDTGEFLFDEKEHIKLREILSNIKSTFILSYNDCSFIRDLYKDYSIESIQRQNNLASKYGKDKVYNELIIKNY